MPGTSIKWRVLFVVVFALLYTAATLWAMVSSLGAAVSGFEPGSPRASEATVQFFDLLSGALMFPFVSLFAPHGAPWPLTWLLMFGNGVFWAVVIVVLWSAVSRRVPRRAPDTPAA